MISAEKVLPTALPVVGDGSDRIGVSVCPNTTIWPPRHCVELWLLDWKRIFAKCQQSLDLAGCLLAAGPPGPVCNSTRIVPLIGSPIIWLPFLLPLFLVPALPSEQCLVFPLLSLPLIAVSSKTSLCVSSPLTFLQPIMRRGPNAA